MWGRNKNICGYWDCEKRIPKDAILCAEHYEDWVHGTIDRCPGCGRFKDITLHLCLDCYFGRPVKLRKLPATIPPTPKLTNKVENSNARIDGSMRPSRFFVYILELDDGVLYVGRTQDLRKKLAEYRKQKKSPIAGRRVKLQFVQSMDNEKAAELRQTELKKLISSNPELIQILISDFRDHMREFNLEEYS